MRHAPIHYDGLWRSLCPAFDQATLARAIRTPVLGRAIRPSTTSRLSDAARRKRPMAGYSTVQNGRTLQNTDENLGPVSFVATKVTPREAALYDTKPPSQDNLKATPVETIRSALARLASSEVLPTAAKNDLQVGERIRLLIHHLLRERNDTLTIFHFECMMAALATPDGSVKAVHRLFLDMEKEDIHPSARLCHHALMALAIHPDYVLRQRVLGIMKEYWFSTRPTDSQLVLLGYLRDEQYELAYTRLTEVLEKKQDIEIWVLDIFIMEFARLGFSDEALALLIRRKHIKGADDGMYNVLYFVLDAFSRRFYHEGTLFAWNTLVRNGAITPPDGILENVLATAARHGDTQLATEAHGMIASRSRVHIHHYESLLEASVAANDIDGALRILCIWEETGFKTGRNNMRAIADYLSRKPEAIDSAERALRRVGMQSRLPPPAVGVIVEAIAEEFGSEEAISLYSRFKELTGEQPPLATIQDMLMHCRDGSVRKQLAREYTERLDQGLDDSRRRSPTVYGRLVAASVEADDLNLAFHFADKAASAKSKFDKVPEWLRKLMQAAFGTEDARIWAVVDKFGGGQSEEVMNVVQMLAQQSKMAKKAEEWRAAAAHQQ